MIWRAPLFVKSRVSVEVLACKFYYIKSLVGTKCCLTLLAGFAVSRSSIPQKAHEFLVTSCRVM